MRRRITVNNGCIIIIHGVIISYVCSYLYVTHYYKHDNTNIWRKLLFIFWLKIIRKKKYMFTLLFHEILHTFSIFFLPYNSMWSLHKSSSQEWIKEWMNNAFKSFSLFFIFFCVLYIWTIVHPDMRWARTCVIKNY